MKLSIQFHLAGLSLSHTGSFLTVFGIDRARSSVHNWVHEAARQPEDGKSPEYVAVDETVIQLDDQQYWLYAAVDPDSNDLLHTQLEPTRNNVTAEGFFVNSARNRMSTTPCFSSTARHRYRKRVTATDCDSAINATGIATASNVSFVR